ncbi:DNA oxidative demethylase AlkB [Amantichitinum ursilacus]|uniref:Alpha-ketoglutarate-dependent dioxygenase AlkB n=1 Tax=Amantichitinum ursilacus TaxID=857265 RepID=A0A0N0GPJ5_9NEIS|nr:DNA oxidative demethylase AlkB [Amantichitinum ursilacus]KPC53873.1 Alpha-ketoglutarate-dependent dioxygenase AlkB [Amantichitinum ursilacus]
MAGYTLDLFAEEPAAQTRTELAAGAWLLHGFVLAQAPQLLAEVAQIEAVAPFRHLITPGGYTMSVAMTNSGALGWVSDARGYRYDPIDPQTGRHWPALPALFADVARRAAAEAGYPGFEPQACLINRYVASARLSLHQDKDELDQRAPIVSVSLGLPATFLFGGLQRNDKTARHRLVHGDVVVWGGPSRLAYHGVAPLAAGSHAATGECRINLTFRKVR